MDDLACAFAVQDDAAEGRATKTSGMLSLVGRIVRRHPIGSGRTTLALLDAKAAVRDSVCATLTPAAGSDARSAEAELALQLRTLAAHLDRRRKAWPALAGVRCRFGPPAWLDEDLRWSAVVVREAEARGLELAQLFVVTEHGWIDRNGSAGDQPRLSPPLRPLW